MMITFKTHASPNVVMPEPLTRYLLGVIGKHPEERGVITAGELEDAIAKLEAAVSVDRKAREEHAGHYHEGDNRHEPHEVRVGLAQHAFPFLNMLRAAHAEGDDIVWGV
jgi:hypothetical protein